MEDGTTNLDESPESVAMVGSHCIKYSIFLESTKLWVDRGSRCRKEL